VEVEKLAAGMVDENILLDIRKLVTKYVTFFELWKDNLFNTFDLCHLSERS
jgi:hypothetical protein